MSAESRVHHADVPGAEELFTPDFLEFIVEAHDKFKPVIEDIRQKRGALIDRAIRDGVLPTFPPESEANSGDWTVPELPEELTRPGIEISGPGLDHQHGDQRAESRIGRGAGDGLSR